MSSPEIGRSRGSLPGLWRRGLTWRRLGEDWGLAASLYDLAGVHAVSGDLDSAAPIFQECVAAFRALGNDWSVALALGHRGVLRSAGGDLDAAAACYAESPELRRAVGDTLGVAETLVHLGNLSRRRGDEAAAVVQLHSALTLVVDVSERSTLPPVLEATDRAADGIRDVSGRG